MSDKREMVITQGGLVIDCQRIRELEAEVASLLKGWDSVVTYKERAEAAEALLHEIAAELEDGYVRGKEDRIRAILAKRKESAL